MEILLKHAEELEKIKKEMTCSSGFACWSGGFTDLCKAKPLQTIDCAICEDPGARACAKSYPFGHGYLCKCRMRAYAITFMGR